MQGKTFGEKYVGRNGSESRIVEYGKCFACHRK